MDNELSHLKSVQRSVSYPSYTIPHCVELVKVLYSQLGGSTFHTRDTIGKILNLSEGTVQMPLSSANQYGLLELKSKEGYRPTQLFIKIYKPISELEKQEALIECLHGPKLYQALIKDYLGDIVPSVTGLSTILYRKHNVAEKASVKAAQVFLENLKYLNILDPENKLIFKGNEIVSQANEVVETIEPYVERKNDLIKVEPQQSVKLLPAVSDHLILDILLKEGRQAKLYYPKDLNNDDLNRITKFIEALRE